MPQQSSSLEPEAGQGEPKEVETTDSPLELSPNSVDHPSKEEAVATKPALRVLTTKIQEILAKTRKDLQNKGLLVPTSVLVLVLTLLLTCFLLLDRHQLDALKYVRHYKLVERMAQTNFYEMNRDDFLQVYFELRSSMEGGDGMDSREAWQELASRTLAVHDELQRLIWSLGGELIGVRDQTEVHDKLFIQSMFYESLRARFWSLLEDIVQAADRHALLVDSQQQQQQPR